MTIEFTHKEYTLKWSDKYAEDGIGCYKIIHPMVGLIAVGTTTSEPMTEEKAIRLIENLIIDLERFARKMDERLAKSF